ncbi:MAG TPA: YqiA/YcfP family alpha/beta fold hydrolase [Ideonella sp.]|uniref:YqiA/YcfP family alpha/beta fold hydrolase n=1 Tax=Ideonella sp. TaxID=1929293 RepID=UPI002C153B44|nr:YqiA/YcfP family alpha/beta fold hydrolase [Ideonella sp.]HSI48183.1 YqiA/YcfP family alpha/beta fold hydrolase [Ideonella sp.]
MAASSSVTHLLYLHGFRSSPLSTKARQVAARVSEQHPGVTWWCPQLPPSPRAAMALLLEGTAAWPRDRMAVMGSSLGGFYATAVAEATGCKAVLLNPAVHAARDLAGQVGEHAGWQDPSQRFVFEPHYVDELRALESGAITDPGRYFAVIAKGDEVLDWREMTARYPGARIRLLEGSDHALSGFDDQIDEVFDFLDLSSRA